MNSNELTPKQEAFCIAVASGKSLSQAYRECYNAIGHCALEEFHGTDQEYSNPMHEPVEEKEKVSVVEDEPIVTEGEEPIVESEETEESFNALPVLSSPYLTITSDGLPFFLLFSFKSSFYILDNRLLRDLHFANIFSHSVAYLLNSLDIVFNRA